MRVQVTDDPHEEAWAWVALIATTLLVAAIPAVLAVIYGERHAEPGRRPQLWDRVR